MDTGTLSVFKYDGWLGKGKEEAQKSVDIPATERGKKVIDSEFGWCILVNTYRQTSV